MGIPSGHVTVAIAMLSHWLCYANSAVNPIIYNFMSGKFRKEFRRTFGCWRCLGSGGRQARARRRYAGTMSNAGSSTYICRFTTGGGSTNYTARTEIQPLSGVTSMSTIADVD